MYIIINYSKLFSMLKMRHIAKKKLEKEAELPATTMRKINRGEKLPPLTLVKICEYLDCSVEQIMFVERRRSDGSLIRENKPRSNWV